MRAHTHMHPHPHTRVGDREERLNKNKTKSLQIIRTQETLDMTAEGKDKPRMSLDVEREPGQGHSGEEGDSCWEPWQGLPEKQVYRSVSIEQRSTA